MLELEHVGQVDVVQQKGRPKSICERAGRTIGGLCDIWGLSFKCLLRLNWCINK